MIISHKHRFVFVKTHKTAGTSIEHSLIEHTDISDTVTGIPDNVVHPARNYHTPKGNYIEPHSSAEFILREWPGLEDYVWFTVERHPYTKTVSAYHHVMRQTHYDPGVSNLDEFIDSDHMNLVNDAPLYTHDGEILVNGILRYEHLEEDFAQLGNRLGLNLQLKYGLNRGKYTPVELSDSQKNRIWQRCLPSLEYTGYDK